MLIGLGDIAMLTMQMLVGFSQIKNGLDDLVVYRTENNSKWLIKCNDQVLHTQRKTIHQFANIETAIKYLKSIGIEQCRIDLSHYSPIAKKRYVKKDDKQTPAKRPNAKTEK